tara:strand:- start:7402 stop:9831 length:2430 start_codon:yes stop_codon:yes gene_type:complete
MANEAGIKIQGFINFPRQKLADDKKTTKWFKDNIDYAENILSSDSDLRASFANKRTNYNLRANIINKSDFERKINPDSLDLDTMPATFQHIGIENSKINLLLGEYSKRKKEYRAYLSSNDQEGISRKDNTMKAKMDAMLTDIIKGEAKSEEEIQRELKEFDSYSRYEFQDIAEITANKILKREYKERSLDFLFLRTFEDLLVAGEQVVYCGVLGGEPVMRRVNPMNLYTLGGNSMYIEDSDVIVEYDYLSVGQVIDDYWDELTDKDINFLENGTSANSSNAMGLNRDISIFDRFGEEDAIQLFHPNELGTRTFGGAFDTNGNVRVVRTCWRSRRKIGKRKYYDEDGDEQSDYVDEKYIAKKDEGEEVKWIWVNEWLEGTKIGDDIYVTMRPLPYSGKSLTNKSKGSPPYVGTVNSTNDYKVQSLTDVMKPMAYSYDIAYYKRELEIATYKGNFAAINASMVPSGWEPDEWMRYITINKFGFLDPTNEILKGPSQGKSAGAFNTLTATNVQIGDPQAIQMYTNILLDIENTLGKLAGVTGAREGQIQNRQAVGNVEREVAQTSHITEKWFAVDSNFRKRALTKYLEACKFAYKKYPKRAQYLLDDMGMVMVENFDEFASSEMDIHVSNSQEDTALYNEIKQLSQAAIQNGQAKISDLIAVAQSESVQETGRKLAESSERIQREQDERQQADRESQEKMQQAGIAAQEKINEREDFNKEEDRKVKYAEIEASKWKVLVEQDNKLNLEGVRRIDSDSNGIDDRLDLERTEIDKEYKQGSLELKSKEVNEKIRSNKENEAIKRANAKKNASSN